MKTCLKLRLSNVKVCHPLHLCRWSHEEKLLMPKRYPDETSEAHEKKVN